MAVSKGMSRRIKDALVQVVAGMQYGDEPAFAQVLDHTRGTYDSYPIARVIPTDQDNNRDSVKSSQRTPRFSIYLHIPLGREGDVQAEANAYNQILDLTDIIIDVLTEGDDYVAGQAAPLTMIDSSIGTYMLTADRGDYSVLPTAQGPVLMAEVIVAVDYSNDSD